MLAIALHTANSCLKDLQLTVSINLCHVMTDNMPCDKTDDKGNVKCKVLA